MQNKTNVFFHLSALKLLSIAGAMQNNFALLNKKIHPFYCFANLTKLSMLNNFALQKNLPI